MKEQWRPVVGFEGWYEVSSSGEVKRTKGGAGAQAGRVLKYAKSRECYRSVTLCKYGIHYQVLVSRMVVGAFCGPIKSGVVIHHVNGNARDNRLENLEQKDGRLHVGDHKKGCWANGQTPTTKLDPGEVKGIRELLEYGWPVWKVAYVFSVSKDAIYDIRLGRTWAWLVT